MSDEPTPQEEVAGGDAQQPNGQAAADMEGPAAGELLVSLKPTLPKVVNSALLRQFLRAERILAPMRRFLENESVLTPARDLAQLVQQHQLPRGVFDVSLALPPPSLFKVQTEPFVAAGRSMREAFESGSIIEANLLIGTNSDVLRWAWMHQAVAAATRFALLPDWDTFDRVLHRLLLGAAEDARAKYLASGDPEEVAEFAFEWLGFKPSGRNRYVTLQAVIEVLLSDEWRADSLQPADRTHSELHRRLRRTVSAARSGWKPLWEHRIAGRRIGTLNLVAPGSETEVGNLVPGSANVETLALGRDFTDPRLKSLASLSDVEQEVCWLVSGGLKWAEAAVAVGLPRTKGRAIQTKAKRRAREAMTREQERVRTTARLVTA